MIARCFIALLLFVFNIQDVSAKNLIVKWQNGTTHADRITALSSTIFTDVDVHWLAESSNGSSFTRLKLPSTSAVNLADILLYLRSSDIIENVEFDQVSQINQATVNTDYSAQWHHSILHSAQLWQRNFDCSSVIIAVIDTGAQLNHPDLVNNLWLNPFEIAGDNIDNDLNGYIDDIYGVNLTNAQALPEDDNGHGTHVTGIIGAANNDSLQTAGVCWQANIMSVKVLNANGSGQISSIIEGLYYAIDNGAQVINLSLEFGDYSQAIADAIEYAATKNVVVVTAAGNSGRNIEQSPVYPAALSQTYLNLISVAATTEDGVLWHKSNYSANLVDVAAPGDGILSTWLADENKYLSGTSMATPMVSAGVAHYLTLNPLANLQQIKPNLWHATHQGSTPYLGKVRSTAALNLPTFAELPVNAYSDFFQFDVLNDTIQFTGIELDRVAAVNFYQLTQQGTDIHHLDIIAQNNETLSIKFNSQRIGYFIATDELGRQSKPLFYEPDLPVTAIDNIKVTSEGVLLNWQMNTDVDYVSVYRRKGFGWSKLADVDSNATEYFDDAVLPDSQYQYRIRAAYEYWSPAANTLVTKNAGYSSTLTLNALDQYWLTNKLFSAPRNQKIAIPLMFNHADDVTYLLNDAVLPSGISISKAGIISGTGVEETSQDISIAAQNTKDNWQQLLDINIAINNRDDWCSTYINVGRFCVAANQLLNSVQWLEALPEPLNDPLANNPSPILQIDSVVEGLGNINFQFLDQTFYTIERIEIWQQGWVDVSDNIIRDEQGLSLSYTLTPERNWFRLTTGLRDLDNDGVADLLDAFPKNSLETHDTDQDGVGDNADVFPSDPSEWLDSDLDGVGDNADVFPNNASEWFDSDVDGVGDNTDVFPNNPDEFKDSDLDGIGDNADVFPNNASEWLDSDLDGVGDNMDAFPNNPDESKDTDLDGIGDNADVFPNDSSEWLDSDLDGVGDNADAFPNNPDESKDSDSDGVGDNTDVYPLDPTKTEANTASGMLPFSWLIFCYFLVLYRVSALRRFIL